MSERPRENKTGTRNSFNYSGDYLISATSLLNRIKFYRSLAMADLNVKAKISIVVEENFLTRVRYIFWIKSFLYFQKDLIDLRAIHFGYIFYPSKTVPMFC